MELLACAASLCHTPLEEMTMRFLALLPVLIALLCAQALRAQTDDSWKLPLAEKAKLLEQNNVERHNIMGLYPSQVEVPLDGSPVNQSTLGLSNIAHSIVWTAYYLEGLCYRYAFLKQSGAPPEEVAAARARADEVFESMYRCQLVTGVRGLQARGYALGHGESYEERENASTRDEWHQGAGEYAHLRWRGEPSHHNYSSAAHALCQYYDLVAEGIQKERAREALDALVSYWVDNDFIIYNYQRRGYPVHILGLTDGKTLNTRVMMAIAAAKQAYHATGKAKFKQMYDRLVKQYGVRGLQEFRTEKDHDDAQHVFCHLEALFRIEDDPELLAGYRKVLAGLWANHKGDAQSTFTYIYLSLTPDSPDREQALREALFSLQTYPADTTLRPRMNSIRTDLKPPYPVYAAAWDNEYLWKGNLLTPDGWLSRTVTQVEVSPEDPMVLYAIDELGDLYQSRDGAATATGWRPIDQGLRSPVRSVAVGHRSRMVAVACEDGFYLSTTAGRKWELLPVPADGGRPVEVQFDPQQAHLLYATTTRGAYRSLDFGERFLGKSWEPLTAGLPPGDAQFKVAPGKPGRIYALISGALFTRRLDEDTWQQGASLGPAENLSRCSWLVADPTNPDRALVGLYTTHAAIGTRSLLQETTDGGLTFQPDLLSIYLRYVRGDAKAVMASLIPGQAVLPAIDPGQPQTIYTAVGRGVLKSSDGGKSWAEKSKGLEIAVARSVIAPRHGGCIFAGTPAGLFLSRDGGESWQDAHLCLQFDKNTRREIGGGAFIDAYWRGRYYGFIDEAAAKAPWPGK